MNTKQHNIINMFDNLSSNYDLANRILSFNMDVAWRNYATKQALKLNSNDNLHILDIACGSADMIISWLKNAEKINRNILIQGADPSLNMLTLAHKKLKEFNNKLEINLIQAEAIKLPFNDNSFNILSISYGLRNVIEFDLAIKEFNRILKPNGLLLILDFFNEERINLLDKLSWIYCLKILPFLGGIITKNKDSYIYLVDSINNFKSTKEMEISLSPLFKTINTKHFMGKVSSLMFFEKV